MLYTVLNNKQIKQTVAIPSDEGLADIAFENGWRVLIPPTEERHLSPNIMKRDAWEWGMYLYDLTNSDLSFSSETGEIPLLVDDTRFSPYVEDVSDEYEEDTDILDNDGDAHDEPTEASYDYEETFHHLNQQ